MVLKMMSSGRSSTDIENDRNSGVTHPEKWSETELLGLGSSNLFCAFKDTWICEFKETFCVKQSTEFILVYQLSSLYVISGRIKCWNVPVLINLITFTYSLCMHTQSQSMWLWTIHCMTLITHFLHKGVHKEYWSTWILSMQTLGNFMCEVICHGYGVA